MPIEKLDQAICTGCGMCFGCCPEDVFRLDEQSRKAIVKYPQDCVACWACESICPVGCIEVSKERAWELPQPY